MDCRLFSFFFFLSVSRSLLSISSSCLRLSLFLSPKISHHSLPSPSQWFDQKAREIDLLENQLKKLHAAAEGLVHRRKGERDKKGRKRERQSPYFSPPIYFLSFFLSSFLFFFCATKLFSIISLSFLATDLSASLHSFVESLSGLASVEDVQSLAKALHTLADTEAKIAKFQHQQVARGEGEIWREEREKERGTRGTRGGGRLWIKGKEKEREGKEEQEKEEDCG